LYCCFTNEAKAVQNDKDVTENYFSLVRYDMIRDAILTCTRKPT